MNIGYCRVSTDKQSASLEAQELQLKNLISRTGVADPLLASTPIVPLDRIEIPPSDELPSLKELVDQAIAKLGSPAGNP